jgi:hypothetical protein
MSSAAPLLYHVRFAVCQQARPRTDLLAVSTEQSGVCLAGSRARAMGG